MEKIKQLLGKDLHGTKLIIQSLEEATQVAKWARVKPLKFLPGNGTKRWAVYVYDDVITHSTTAGTHYEEHVHDEAYLHSNGNIYNTPESADTETLVCEDIKKRQQLGLSKYGISVTANPLELKQWLQHAYEEVLDTAVYMQRAMQELDKADVAKPELPPEVIDPVLFQEGGEHAGIGIALLEGTSNIDIDRKDDLITFWGVDQVIFYEHTHKYPTYTDALTAVQNLINELNK